MLEKTRAVFISDQAYIIIRMRGIKLYGRRETK